jgi:pullulanase
MVRVTCLLIVLVLAACHPKSMSDPDSIYTPSTTNDLGVHYTPDRTTFKIWSPVAHQVHLHLYQDAAVDQPIETHSLHREADGIWTLAIARDLNGLFYTFQVETENGKLEETPGIYAKAVGVNGKRGAIIDFSTTNPPGWQVDQRPPFVQRTGAVIYEMHVRDFSIHASTSHKYRGKYLGVAEGGTVNPTGQSTGLDHLVELGVTHVHLLPVFDFRSLDETKTDSAQYNWGYDPQNYNVPEGSYATDPYDPAARIREFKQMVQGLHARGLRVIMDVVYNHTGATYNSNFNLETPDYYYRKTADGKWSDAAACGNETASEQPMMRKYMIESCLHWVREYHIDGFRFDLMGIHDIATMNELTATLLKEEPTLLFYGEGWTAGASPLPDSLRALKKNTHLLNDVAAFSDDLRDALKGSVFDHQATGFVSGAVGVEPSIRFGVAGATRHPQVDYAAVNYSKSPWAREPWQCINYVSCHDNHTLWDKLAISASQASEATRIRMDRLANAIVLTSQGIPFLHAGEELLRTKKEVENSYNKPDSINQIDWNRKKGFEDTFTFYRELIALRKAHPAFRLTSTELVSKLVRFSDSPAGTVVYQISGRDVSDSWGEIFVAYNGNESESAILLPTGDWIVRHDGNQLLKTTTKIRSKVKVPGISLMILSQQ